MTDACSRNTIPGSMAGGSLEKLGMMFSKTRDLMRSGVIKENEKPIWYDVYADFPPKREPTYEKPPKHRSKQPDYLHAFLYNEDVVRATQSEIHEWILKQTAFQVQHLLFDREVLKANRQNVDILVMTTVLFMYNFM